jgi:calcium-dependent protein kinase
MSLSNSLSDYIEIRNLGSGAFAEVFLCLHKPTKTERAVKHIRKQALTKSQKDSKYLLKEFQILRELDHPHILKCFEMFESDLFYYVSTEYCPGGDLFSEIVKLSKFTEKQAASIMYQLLSVLVYCHEKRVTHRDLKPENILLLESGSDLCIKVADFGNSIIFDPDSRLSGCFGSAYYLAPEVFTDSYNEKCDIWSVGIILYILLTGRPPYPGRSNEAILACVKDSPLKIKPINTQGLSAQAVDLLKALLRVNMNLRPSAKQLLKHPWILNHREGKSENIELALHNLKEFNSKSKLREAVHVYIASQISSNQDLKYFRKCFQEIDKDGDGKITKEELFDVYSKQMSKEEAEKVSQEIIQKLDKDEDGNIDYTEFLASCIERQRQTSLEDLEIAFNMFDIDRSGTITVNEIKMILNDGDCQDDAVFHEIMKEADTNGDGVIDLREFLNLMSSTIQTTASVKLINTISQGILKK